MKLSKETIGIIKNFASINSNLLLKEGNVLSTINAHKNVLADAVLAESFPRDFGIYDTNEFLGVLSLFDDPEIDFKEKFALIKEGSSSVKFYAADASVLTIPSKKINFPATDIEFDLSATQLASIQRTASVLRAMDVSIVGKEGALEILVGDLKNSTANSYNIRIGDTDKEFSANLKIDNMKLMSQDYKVSLSSKKISRFSSADDKMTVYIAMESTSSF